MTMVCPVARRAVMALFTLVLSSGVIQFQFLQRYNFVQVDFVYRESLMEQSNITQPRQHSSTSSSSLTAPPKFDQPVPRSRMILADVAEETLIRKNPPSANETSTATTGRRRHRRRQRPQTTSTPTSTSTAPPQVESLGVTTADTFRKTQNLHSTHLTELPFQDWEEDCIKDGAVLVRHDYEGGRPRCRAPPPYMDEGVAIRFSSTGTVFSSNLRWCAHSFQKLRSLKQSARSFLRGVPVDPTTSTSGVACDACRIVDVARDNNLTIAFVGDSTQAHVWQGLKYELQRRNYTVRLSTNHSVVDGRLTPGWTEQIMYREIMEIESPEWTTTTTTTREANLPTIVTLKFFAQFRLPFSNPRELDEVANSADVLVLGFGLHWNSDTDYYDHKARPQALTVSMTELFHYLRHNSTRNQLLVHREASAQHFDAPAGDFSAWQKLGDSKGLKCQPITKHPNSPTLLNWREQRIQQAATQAGYRYVRIENTRTLAPPPSTKDDSPELVVLPYFDFTAQHHHQHPRSGWGTDCTHYCANPYIYLPLWRTLRLALDRKFASKALQ